MFCDVRVFRCLVCDVCFFGGCLVCLFVCVCFEFVIVLFVVLGWVVSLSLFVLIIVVVSHALCGLFRSMCLFCFGSLCELCFCRLRCNSRLFRLFCSFDCFVYVVCVACVN